MVSEVKYYFWKNSPIIVLIFVVINLVGCGPYKAGPVSINLNVNSIGTLWFKSSDGYDLIAYTKSPSVTLEGVLSIPKNHNGSAVIFSHGSGGVGNLHRNWRDFLEKYGFAVFLLDHFRPRNTINVLHSQVRVTEQQMAFDILKASALIQSHPLINSEKIYHIGWSKGASAGLLAAFEKVQEMVFNGKTYTRIAGFIEFYPWCGIRGKLKTTSPVMILHGTDDDYTPISLCEMLAEDIKKTGSDIRIKRFKGAAHGFDNWHKNWKTSDSLTVRKSSDDCTLKIDPATLDIRSLNGKWSVDTYENRKAFLTNCAETGVTTGGSPEYESRTKKIILNFLSERKIK
tara:strand:+ start:70 stop:1098 length:1029 start_codon:yes stop_codon:yes gene_type:complete